MRRLLKLLAIVIIVLTLLGGCAAVANKYIDTRARCRSGDPAACIEMSAMIQNCQAAKIMSGINVRTAGIGYWDSRNRAAAQIGAAIGGALDIAVTCAGQDTIPGTPGAEVAAPVARVPYTTAQP